MSAEQCLAHIEAELTKLVRRAAYGRLQVAGAATTLERSAYVVLGWLADTGPQRGSELATALGLDLSTVSRQVAALTELGLVERRPDDTDRRASVLALTVAGSLALDAVRTARRDLLRELLRTWAATDRAELARLLGRLNADLDCRAGGTTADQPPRTLASR